jgi:hypothetical protein
MNDPLSLRLIDLATICAGPRKWWQWWRPPLGLAYQLRYLADLARKQERLADELVADSLADSQIAWVQHCATVKAIQTGAVLALPSRADRPHWVGGSAA